MRCCKKCHSCLCVNAHLAAQPPHITILYQNMIDEVMTAASGRLIIVSRCRSSQSRFQSDTDSTLHNNRK